MSDAEIERVADRVFEKMQAQIGRNAVQVVIWAASIAVLSVLVWLGVVKVSHAADIAFHLSDARQ
jgi:hypothetical protein